MSAEQSTEYRLQSLESSALSTGQDIAGLKTDVGFIRGEVSGLAEWLERHERVSEERHRELSGKVDRLDENVGKLMRHFGIE